MINYSEIPDADAWEAFCRDYLAALGFVVTVPPGRGPDNGRDLIVTEQLKGHLATRPFVWLVSCKHFATSGSAVGTSDEINITDRLHHHAANGFIGFYSTLASGALVQRLKELREQSKIDAFEIFDGPRIEKAFYGTGMSDILLQYLPKSHTALRPIQPLLGTYEPLLCDVCQADLLKLSFRKQSGSVVLFAYNATNVDVTQHIYFACKGRCDERLTHRLNAADQATSWDDLEDYFNPLLFVRKFASYMTEVRENPTAYSDTAHERMLRLLGAASQLTLRQTSAEDRERYITARQAEEFGV